MTKFPFAAATAAIALLTAAQAQAHAKLVSSTPADGAAVAVAAPKQIVLKFSEKLQPKFSGLALTMPAMNNMAMATKVSVAKDGVTMTATPARPLMPGAYMVSWHAVAADTHRMEGKFSFTVR